MRTILLSVFVASAAAWADDPEAPKGRFEFGSYGRVGVGSDLAGRLGRSANIVAHGPRLIEDGYAELGLRREDDLGSLHSRMVATVAFFPPFFHFDGKSAQSIGIRNLYAEGTVGNFSAWVGSRMYRGDDIYLLNFWPLDDLNTVGAGAQLRFGKTQLRLHAGLHRLDQPSTYQLVSNDNPVGFGAVTTPRLDRPRIIESAKLTHELEGPAGIGVRLSLYAEGHQLPGGVRRSTVTGDERPIPGDFGLLAGGQATVWHEKTFAHLWFRQAFGLATTDELSLPTVFNNQHTTAGANATRLALAGGWDSKHLGLLIGGYLDLVRDAGVAPTGSGKYDEGAFSARLQWYFTEHFGLAAEASGQRRVYALVDPATGALRAGSLAQFGVMPYFAPLGHGLFARPQLRVIYALSVRDAGARSFAPVDDPYSSRTIDHYLGVSVEWWFNATTYPVR